MTLNDHHHCFLVAILHHSTDHLAVLVGLCWTVQHVTDVSHCPATGSFGVAEDHFFKKATEYARQRGLPRVYIACNSGARVGLVEEIMPKLRVHWNDAADPSKVRDWDCGISSGYPQT